MALPTGDHASNCQSEGCVPVDRDELVLQFHRRVGHTVSPRGHRMETVPHARVLLRVQLYCRLFP